MENYNKRVTAIYNDCWKLYREYTQTHDMCRFNKDKDALARKYDGKSDAIDLLLWIGIRVQTLADMQKGETNGNNT